MSNLSTKKEGGPKPAPNRGAGRNLACLVGRRPINRRYRDVAQAQVDGELPAVMHEVVEDHAAQYGHPRHGEYGFTAGEQGPRRHRSEEHTSELQSLRHLV